MEPILLTLFTLFDRAESLATDIIVQAHCLAKDPLDRLSSFPQVSLLGSWFLDERTTRYISLRDQISTISETLKAFRRPNDDVDGMPTPRSPRGYYFDSTTVPRADQQSLATILRKLIAELETYDLPRIIYEPVGTKSFEYLTKLNSSLVCRLRQSGTDWAVGYGKYKAQNHIYNTLCKGKCSPETIFLFAVESEFDEIVHSLLFDPTTSKTLTTNARTLTRACDRQGLTALHLAVSRGSVKMVKSLMDAGADAQTTDNSGSTPLQLLFSSTAFRSNRHQFPFVASDRGQLPHRSEPLTKTIPIIEPHATNTSLVQASGSSRVTNSLPRIRVDVHGIPSSGKTILPRQAAAHNGRQAIVMLLLEKRVDVNADGGE